MNNRGMDVARGDETTATDRSKGGKWGGGAETRVSQSEIKGSGGKEPGRQRGGWRNEGAWHGSGGTSKH